MRVKIRKVKDEARIPEFKSEGAAGADLYAAHDAIIYAGCRSLIQTGFCMEIEPGHEGQIRSRSGLALEHGVFVMNSPGTIDSDYRGEVGVVLANFGRAPYEVEVGDRIAQLVIALVMTPRFVVVTELEGTGRGAGGFGSTG